MTTPTIDEADARFAARAAPWVNALGMKVQAIEKGFVRLRLPHDARIVHTNGVVSGQSLMALADTSMVMAVASYDGFRSVATVSLGMNFMRPALGTIDCETRILRFGRRLVFGEMVLKNADTGDVVASASSTYALLDAESR